MLDHPVSKFLLVVAGLAALVGLCLFLIFLVVDMSRRRIGNTAVSYRPIRARFLDWLLIFRLWRKK